MNLEIRQFWDGRVPKVMQIDVDSGPETRLPSLPPAAPSLPGLPSPFDLDVPEPESGPSAIEGIQERFVPLFEGFPNALRRQLVVKGQEQECYVESRDGLQWAMSDGTSIRLFDMKTGVERWKVAAGIITRQLMFSYDGSMLASAGTIRPVQMADLKEPIEHPSPPTSSVDLARHIHSLSPAPVSSDLSLGCCDWSANSPACGTSGRGYGPCILAGRQDDRFVRSIRKCDSRLEYDRRQRSLRRRLAANSHEQDRNFA